MAEKTTLPKSVFEVEVRNHELLKLAYDAYLANNRLASATTKQRGEVRGGGKKPWNQKRTGRARFGSIRNPIWRGGGIVFGPRGNENYTKKISKTSKRVALRQALTLKAQAGAIMVEDYKLTGKTKDAVKALEKAGIADKRRILGVVDVKTPEIIRSTSNLQNLKVVSATYLNVFDILNADVIVFGTEALKKTTEWLGEEK